MEKVEEENTQEKVCIVGLVLTNMRTATEKSIIIEEQCLRTCFVNVNVTNTLNFLLKFRVVGDLK